MKTSLDVLLLNEIAESTQNEGHILQRTIVSKFAHFDTHYTYLQIRRLHNLGVIEKFKRGDGAVALRLSSDYRRCEHEVQV